MLCPQCQSSNRREFRTEVMIHNGSVNGGIAPLFTFPHTWVCFECGCTTFNLAQNELLELRGACVKVGAEIAPNGTVASASSKRSTKSTISP
jgi:hypothetical protein